MNLFFPGLVVLFLTVAAPGSIRAQTTNVPVNDAAAPPAPNFRISAIAGFEDDYYVGIINEDTDESRLLRIGDVFGGYTIEQIDPQKQQVMIARDQNRFAMMLRGDSTLVVGLKDGEVPPEMMTGNEEQPGEEEMRSLEDFIRANYKAAGMSSPNDPIPEEYTKPVSKEEALQRMAESVGMEVPPDAFEPVTREEFLMRFDPTNALNPEPTID